jgi:hypothetical protein
METDAPQGALSRRSLLDEDLLAEVQTDACLRAIAACLRRAQEDVEAVIQSQDTPLTKIDRVAGILEQLGDLLESCADWVPR